MAKYRSRAECREIVKAIAAETARPLQEFGLTRPEDNFFRRRSERALDRAAKDTSAFTQYYALPLARPLLNLIFGSAAVIVAVIIATALLFAYSPPNTDESKLFAAAIAAVVVAVGWVIAGGFSHRNTIRQATNQMLFARFSQNPINEAFYLFGKAFGYEETNLISTKSLNDLRATGCEDDRKAAASVGFLLNYFELIANGVIRGDLDHRLVKDTIRGGIVYFYDRCEPFIRECAHEEPRVYEQLRRLRANYREP